MQHRDELQQTSQAQDSRTTTGTLTQLMVTQQLVPGGKHRAPVAPRIPAQSAPTHDVVLLAPSAPAAPAPAEAEAATPVEVEAEPEPEVVVTETATEAAAEPRPAAESRVVRPPARAARPEDVVPHSAHWKASHLPRTVAAVTLALAAAGTAALGGRYAQTRASDDFLSLVVGLGVVVVLWAVVIASTPQVVTIEGSWLTVHNTGGSERFDLADALQPIDLVGNPRTSHWAVLLHRPGSTTVVLRRNDVDPLELDPIVRHYRMVAEQRHTERDARFSR
jgi:hypothetical protein